MASGIPIYKLATAQDLHVRLQAMQGKVPRPNTLLLVSVGMLPIDGAPDAFWGDLSDSLHTLANRYKGEIFTVSDADRGILIEVTEANQIGMLSDLKVSLLRLIQQYFPENFGMVDQTRLIRSIDLRIKLSNAIKFLERAVSQAGAPRQARGPMRRLSEEDIQMVTRVNAKLGSLKFSKAFIRHQRLALIEPGKPPVDTMHEYFVGMDMLKKHVFQDVELRGSGNLFNQLTVILDRLILDAYGDVNPERAKCSINLNVESVFTRSFETFLGDGDEQVFSNIVFEFRQADILQHYDEFMVAANLINQKAGAIAVDSIFPETLGVVDLTLLNASLAKIFWRSGAEKHLVENKDKIAEFQAAGTRFALARLDDEHGVELGHQLGITMFQGFHIDKLLDDAAKS